MMNKIQSHLMNLVQFTVKVPVLSSIRWPINNLEYPRFNDVHFAHLCAL